MKLTLRERIVRAIRLLRRYGYRVKPINPTAGTPNAPSPVRTATEPTVKPGAGLTGKQKFLHQLMHATVGNPYHWTYNAIRPLLLPRTRIPATAFASPAKLHHALMIRITNYRSDCSWGVKTLFWLAGILDDPTGERWNPYGNSSSTYAHLDKRPGLDNAYHPSERALAACRVGDILLVGVNGADHMTCIMETGPDPLLWSDGHAGAPDSYRVSQDSRRPISVCVPKGWK